MATQHSGRQCPFTDPERLFEDLSLARGESGLPFSDTYQARMVTRYDEIVQALHDPATFSSAPTVPELPSPWREKFEDRVPPRTLFGLDNPDHDRLRASVNTFFIPRRLARYEHWIEAEAHRLIDTFAATGTTDLKTSFALPLPVRVVSHLVGLDADRAEWISAALDFFLDPRYAHRPGTPESRAELLLELHAYVREVMAERKIRRRDDLVSHIWNERDLGNVEMTDFEMLSMFPGLILAGQETSSNFICMALSHLLADPARYSAAQRDEDARAAALEELFRYESPITGMKRLVTTDTVLGGVPLKAGEIVLLAYASGSRDSSKFAHPDRIDFSRTWGVPHLGFGQGMHACIGAALSRLLLRIELRVLHERLPDLRLAVPAADLEHSEVSEGRGIVALPVAWSPQSVRVDRHRTSGTAVMRQAIPVTVTERRKLTYDVVELTLRPDDPSDLPVWEPGAHVDLELPDGALRQYSLCGTPGARTLRIAVLNEPAGRGGSRTVHERVHVGDRLAVRGPRNHFRLKPASSYVFVAGGIGVTPLLPMIDVAASRRDSWKLIYLGRSQDRMAYLRELVAAYGSHVVVWPSDERGRFDLDRIWAEFADHDTGVYACGPERLLSALEDIARRREVEHRLVLERFAPRQVEHGPNRPVIVALARSGDEIVVAEDESILDAINRAGASVLSTCREGACGTCEVRVLDGVPEHRDSVLSVEERLANDTMMTCVSRCRGNRLVLDI